jgi:hypothetical protein
MWLAGLAENVAMQISADSDNIVTVEDGSGAVT